MDDSFNKPGLSPGASALSPYLNFDPSLLHTDEQYLYPEGAKSSRGRFELWFSQIGGCVITGTFFGGARGVLAGRQHAVALQGRVWRTQMLNHVAKNSASTAQSLGAMATIYAISGILLEQTPVPEELNVLMSGSLTGALYKCPGGLRTSAMGAGVGATLATGYLIFSNRHRLRDMFTS